jgi:beta-N-acetylhexosaminidase
MELRQEHLGQLLACGFHGTTLHPDTQSFLRKIRPGGVILFKKNIESLDQLTELCFMLHNLYDPPPFIAVDQEGGPVNRLSPLLPETPNACALGQHGNPETIEDLALLTGQALRTIGIDLDFAPVLDLSAPDFPNGIGKRSFSTEPEIVIRMGGAFLRGLLGQGVAGTLKHFPGLGASTIDSHASLPTIDKKKSFLENEDMKPFEILSSMAPMVMIGHGYYTSLTIEKIPASLSSEIVRDILRKKHGFKGVIITDDMEMGALRDYLSSGEEAVRALHAGCDMVLYCSSNEMVENAVERITAAWEKRDFNESQIHNSLNRIFELKRSFLIPEKRTDAESRVKDIVQKMKVISEKVLSTL